MACPYKPVLSDSSSLSQQAPLQSRGKWEDRAAIQNILTEDGRAESSGQTTTAAVSSRLRLQGLPLNRPPGYHPLTPAGSRGVSLCIPRPKPLRIWRLIFNTQASSSPWELPIQSHDLPNFHATPRLGPAQPLTSPGGLEQASHSLVTAKWVYCTGDLT